VFCPTIAAEASVNRCWRRQSWIFANETSACCR